MKFPYNTWEIVIEAKGQYGSLWHNVTFLEQGTRKEAVNHVYEMLTALGAQGRHVISQRRLDTND